MLEKVSPNRRILINDSILREGLDVPNVNFSFEQQLSIAKLMDQAKVPEMEVVAPGKVFQDLEFVKKGFETGIILKNLKSLSESVEEVGGLRVSELAPVVGKHIFVHKSSGHLESPDLFELFDPQLVGSKRALTNK
jgi:isopropylmalate/homocitrate/citramalate synthase